MPLSTDDRAAFLALLPLLGPGASDDGVDVMVRDHWRACLDEVGADPGFDKVRAGLIRVFRQRLAANPDVGRSLAKAVQVVKGFPEQVAAGDATLLLARHPAWVGLSALELADWDPTVARDPLEWALTLAAAGFSVLAGKGAIGRGEVLWALAEEAAEVGWSDRARGLLAQASRGPFADPAHGVQVRLLLALRLLDDGDPEAEALLEQVARSAEADGRTATHARHLLAELHAEASDAEGARYWFGQALQSVDPEEEPAIAERLAAEIANLDELEDPDEDTAEVEAPQIEF